MTPVIILLIFLIPLCIICYQVGYTNGSYDTCIEINRETELQIKKDMEAIRND